jgi:hypothetical protein
LREPKKVPYLCSPLRKEAAGVEKRTEKKSNFFLRKLAKSKVLLTFALPIEKKGKRKGKESRPEGRQVSPTGGNARSLNAWKRQMVRLASAS